MKFLFLIAIAMTTVSTTALASGVGYKEPCPLMMQKRMLLSDISPLPDSGTANDPHSSKPAVNTGK